MGLCERLKEKSKTALLYSDTMSSPCETVLVWQRDDAAAARLCRQTGRGMARASHHLCPLKKGDVTALRELLGTLVQAGENGPPAARCYVLWVWIDVPPLPLTPLQDEFGMLVVADCCTIGRDGTIPDGFRFAWHLDDGTADLDNILMVFSMIGPAEMPALLLNMGTQKHVFRISVVLYNAVEHDLACRLRACLEAILEGNPSTQKESFLNSFSLTESEKQAILRKLPHPEDLPILDAGAMRDQVAHSAGRTLWPFFTPARNGRSAYQPADILIGDTLNRLFGLIDGSPCTEWLLDEALAALPDLCEQQLRKLGLEKRCYQQPLRFLQSNAPELVFERRNRASDEQRLARFECEEMLRGVTTPSKSASGLAALEELRPYFACWDRCLEHGLTAAWWDAVGKLIHSEPIRSQAERKAKELYQGIMALDRLVWKPLLSTEHAACTGLIDWRRETPDQLLESLYSDEEFTDAQLASLAANAQKNAEAVCHAASFGATLLLFDEQITDRLYEVQGPGGSKIFRKDSSGLLGRSYTGVLRGVPIPFLGRQTLWEVRIDACEQV